MSEQPPPPTRSIPLSSAHRWRAFGICVTVAAVTILDLSKINVALPSIEEALGASSTALQLLVAGYVLTFGLALVPAGRIGDQRSRRTLFIIGLSLFTLMSLLCGIAPNSEFLLVARLLQGVAAGIQMPQVIGLIQELFPAPRERGRAFGAFGAIIGVAVAFGPTVGGLLIAVGGPEHGWRWTFWMNVPLCLIALVLVIWMLPTTRRPSAAKLALDPIGIVLFGLATLALMWPFLFTTGSADDDPNRWWLLVVAAVFTAAFIAWERHYEASGKEPLIALGLFRIPSYRNGTLLMTAYFAASPPMFLLANLFLQTGAGFAAVFAGMVTIGFALSSALTSWLSGLWLQRFGQSMVVWGTVVVLVGVGALAAAALFVPVEAVGWVMAAIMLLAGFGAGFIISPNQALTLMEVPVKQGGLAGSVGQLGQRVGTSIGTAVALSMFYSTIRGEESGQPHYTVYQDAYAHGMLAVALLLGVALIVGVIDLGSQRRAARAR